MSDETEATPSDEPTAEDQPAAEDQTAGEETPSTDAASEPASEAPAEPAAEAPATEYAKEAAAEDAPAEDAAEPAAEDAPAAEAPAEEAASAPEDAAEPAAEEAPAAEAPAEEAASAPEEAPTAEAPAATPAPDPNAPMPKPGEAGYDPDQGLGLVENTAVLGPPNMGGFESGEIVTGTVLTVNRREAEVDVGNGRVGVIGDRHWSSGSQVDLTTVLKSGDSVDAAVLARADLKKRITLSHLWAQQKQGWEAAETAAKDKSDLSGTVTETVKGGLSLDVNGIRAFMPASLVDVTTVNDLKPFVGQTVEVRVIEADRTKQRLIVSRKAALRANQRQQAKQALADIKVGQEMTGKVAQITDFGAFVDVDGVRGLVHKSEIGWSRARDPQRDLKVGQEVQVKVIKVQPSRNRLGLSMKSGTDPLGSINKGDRFEGSVSRLVDFGAFVALPSGVEGLVHVSEMAEYRVFAPEEIVIPGEKVWVKVLKVDRKRRTIDLSMAQAVVPDPPEEAEANAAAAAARDAAASGSDDDYAEDTPSEAAASEEE
ncbi:MAG: S1 RNA-binding domain-containing protein [Actinomycetota bacterium]